MGTTNSARLRERIELGLPALDEAGEALVAHPKYTLLYPQQLLMIHWMVRASVPLMEAAYCQIERKTERVDSDAEVAKYYVQHILEEKGHDEWLISDLEVLGLARDEVLYQMPSSNIAAGVGAQYYWINHYDPIALLGYIALLEGYPPTEARVQSLIDRSGLPKAAFRTFVKHAALDRQHKADLDILLDSCAFTDRDIATMGTSALFTIACVTKELRLLVDRIE